MISHLYNFHHQEADSDESDMELSLEDSRVRHLEKVVMTSLKVKSDKWAKTIADDDNKLLLQRYFDDKSILLLVFSATVIMSRILPQDSTFYSFLLNSLL